MVFFFWKPQSEYSLQSRSNENMKGKPETPLGPHTRWWKSCLPGGTYLFSEMGHPCLSHRLSFYFPNHWYSLSPSPWFLAGPPSFCHRRPWRISPTSYLLSTGRKRSAAKGNPQIVNTVTDQWLNPTHDTKTSGRSEPATKPHKWSEFGLKSNTTVCTTVLWILWREVFSRAFKANCHGLSLLAQSDAVRQAWKACDGVWAEFSQLGAAPCTHPEQLH